MATAKIKDRYMTIRLPADVEIELRRQAEANTRTLAAQVHKGWAGREQAPMKCPVCGAWTLVKETRQRQDNAKYRRYECANTHRFTTLETVAKVIVAKKPND